MDVLQIVTKKYVIIYQEQPNIRIRFFCGEREEAEALLVRSQWGLISESNTAQQKSIRNHLNDHGNIVFSSFQRDCKDKKGLETNWVSEDGLGVVFGWTKWGLLLLFPLRSCCHRLSGVAGR